ncbi:MAG TPA: hypothetical protein PLQ67_02900, partial [Burkholderiaceae bacterium]|nr:hypothetical protein [Burkholderiaceae bacterium]
MAKDPALVRREGDQILSQLDYQSWRELALAYPEGMGRLRQEVQARARRAQEREEKQKRRALETQIVAKPANETQLSVGDLRLNAQTNQVGRTALPVQDASSRAQDVEPNAQRRHRQAPRLKQQTESIKRKEQLGRLKGQLENALDQNAVDQLTGRQATVLLAWAKDLLAIYASEPMAKSTEASLSPRAYGKIAASIRQTMGVELLMEAQLLNAAQTQKRIWISQHQTSNKAASGSQEASMPTPDWLPAMELLRQRLFEHEQKLAQARSRASEERREANLRDRQRAARDKAAIALVQSIHRLRAADLYGLSAKDAAYGLQVITEALSAHDGQPLANPHPFVPPPNGATYRASQNFRNQLGLDKRFESQLIAYLRSSDTLRDQLLAVLGSHVEPLAPIERLRANLMAYLDRIQPDPARGERLSEVRLMRDAKALLTAHRRIEWVQTARGPREHAQYLPAVLEPTLPALDQAGLTRTQASLLAHVMFGRTPEQIAHLLEFDGISSVAEAESRIRAKLGLTRPDLLGELIARYPNPTRIERGFTVHHHQLFADLEALVGPAAYHDQIVNPIAPMQRALARVDGFDHDVSAMDMDALAQAPLYEWLLQAQANQGLRKSVVFSEAALIMAAHQLNADQRHFLSVWAQHPNDTQALVRASGMSDSTIYAHQQHIRKIFAVDSFEALDEKSPGGVQGLIAYLQWRHHAVLPALKRPGQFDRLRLERQLSRLTDAELGTLTPGETRFLHQWVSAVIAAHVPAWSGHVPHVEFTDLTQRAFVKQVRQKLGMTQLFDESWISASATSAGERTAPTWVQALIALHHRLTSMQQGSERTQAESIAVRQRQEADYQASLARFGQQLDALRDLPTYELSRAEASKLLRWVRQVIDAHSADAPKVLDPTSDPAANSSVVIARLRERMGVDLLFDPGLASQQRPDDEAASWLPAMHAWRTALSDYLSELDAARASPATMPQKNRDQLLAQLTQLHPADLYPLSLTEAQFLRGWVRDVMHAHTPELGPNLYVMQTGAGPAKTMRHRVRQALSMPLLFDQSLASPPPSGVGEASGAGRAWLGVFESLDRDLKRHIDRHMPHRPFVIETLRAAHATLNEVGGLTVADQEKADSPVGTQLSYDPDGKQAPLKPLNTYALADRHIAVLKYLIMGYDHGTITVQVLRDGLIKEPGLNAAEMPVDQRFDPQTMGRALGKVRDIEQEARRTLGLEHPDTAGELLARYPDPEVKQRSPQRPDGPEYVVYHHALWEALTNWQTPKNGKQGRAARAQVHSADIAWTATASAEQGVMHLGPSGLELLASNGPPAKPSAHYEAMRLQAAQRAQVQLSVQTLFDPKRTPSWLLGATESIDSLRQRLKQRASDHAGQLKEGRDEPIAQAQLTPAFRRTVAQRLLSLTTRETQMLWLHMEGGLTLNEISDLVGAEKGYAAKIMTNLPRGVTPGGKRSEIRAMIESLAQ